MDTRHDMKRAARLLGEVLDAQGLSFDLVLIGAGALLLKDLIRRPSMDLDIVARVDDHGEWVSSKPLPAPLVEAVRDVAQALDLPRRPRDDKDWLNPGPAILFRLGLPAGFRDRVDTMRFGGLTLRLPARQDLITLKLWAATDNRRGSKRQDDLQDLQELEPTLAEIREALRWCQAKDGRPDFFELDAVTTLEALGFDPEEVAHG